MAGLNDLYSSIQSREQQNFLRRNTPYALDAATPGVRLQSYDDSPNTYGQVDRRNPSTIMINKRANLSTAPQVVPHEYEHVLQNNVDARYPNGYTYDVVNELAKRKQISYGDAKNLLVSSLQNAAGDSGLPSQLKRLSGTEGNYNGKLGSDQYSLKEQWADLSSLESLSKKDFTKDPYILKSVFNNDPDIAAVYKGATGLRTNRLDANDLPPMTPAGPTPPPIASQTAPSQQQPPWWQGLGRMFQ